MCLTLKASGRTSATTIQIIHPAAKPVQKGKNLLNASAHMNEGTATMGYSRGTWNQLIRIGEKKKGN